MERYEINKYLTGFKEKVSELEESINVTDLNEKIRLLSEKTNEEGFWNDQNNSKKIFDELNGYKEKLKGFNDIKSKLDDLVVLDEMALEDSSLDSELEESILNYNNELEEFEISVLLNDEYDDSNCFLELHPGAGGTESMDWAEMLYRMYLRFCQKMNFKVELVDYLAGEEAGIKSVTILIKGHNAYGYLKSERGVHRLVRISPFDSNKRRHTSFCSCDVTPEITQDKNVDLNLDDVKIDVYHSSGAGGQSVNTTDSAVRLTHKPTGIVVTCQNERSQLKNKEVAFSILKSKLLQLKIKAQEEELNKLKGEHMNIDFGSQIRSYVFHPYSLVKDHRTNYEIANTNLVMDGYIKPFIDAYLKYSKKMS
ncbi:MAG: peptide chain release factor 2 [bacterium]|nr:peptide chain release factor 2 [bacterium]